MKNVNFPLISKVRRAVATATLKDSSMVFVGNLTSSVLGAVFFFLLAHQGGPYVLGVFGVSIAIAVTVADLFDVAIDNAVVNFGARMATRGYAIRSGIVRKLCFSTVAAAALWFSAPLLVGMLGKPEILGTVRAAVWLIPIKSFYGFVKTVFQISRQFHLDAGIEIFSSLIRLFGFMLIFVINVPILSLALWTYIGSLAVSILIALPKIVPVLLERSGTMTQKDFTSYQSWMTLSFAASAVSSRLDVFFLTRMTSLEVVGWYQAAFRLFMPVQQLAGSLSRVFAPRFAHFSSGFQTTKYLKKSLLLSGGLAASMFLSIPFFKFLIPLLYGKQFYESIYLAYGLIFYFALFLFSTPWWSRLLYYYSNARRFAVLSILQLMMLAGAIPFSISAFGGVGVAAALFSSLLFSTIFAAI